MGRTARRLVAVVLALAASACAGPEGADPAPGARSAPVRVMKVTDGDTIRVRRGGVEERVRLIGIDAPEVDWYGGEAECFGEEAGRFAEGLLEGRDVRLELDREEFDRYGRTLAYVYSEGRMINEVLVRRGFATVSIYLPNERQHAVDLLAAEARARADGAGLWSACG